LGLLKPLALSFLRGSSSAISRASLRLIWRPLP